MTTIGTFIDSQTLSLAATASGTFTHGLAQTPHMVWGTPKFSSSALTTNLIPYLSLQADSASVSAWNRGSQGETWTVYTVFLHSIPR